MNAARITAGQHQSTTQTPDDVPLGRKGTPLWAWATTYISFTVAALLASGVADTIGIGHTWPFFVVIPLVAAQIATGIMVCVTLNDPHRSP